MFLDKFEEMMTRGIVPSNGVATYHQYIVNNFNPGNFVEFLHLYNVRKAPEVRAKVGKMLVVDGEISSRFLCWYRLPCNLTGLNCYSTASLKVKWSISPFISPPQFG